MGQGISDATNYVVRQGNVVCMHVEELVIHCLVIPHLEMKLARELLAGRHVVPLREIAGILALHFVILMLLVLMSDVSSLSQLVALVAG